MKDKAKLKGPLGAVARSSMLIQSQPARYRPQLHALLFALWFYADTGGMCYPTREDLRKRTGLSYRTLRRAALQLQALGMLTILSEKRRTNTSGKKGGTVEMIARGGWNKDTRKNEATRYQIATPYRLIGGGGVGVSCHLRGRCQLSPLTVTSTCAESFSEKTPPPEASTDAPDTGLVTVPPEIAPIPGNQARNDTAGAISSGTAVEDPHPVGALGTDEAGMVLKAVFSVDTRGKRPSEIQREKAREVDKVLNLFPRRGNTRAAIPDTPRDDESRTAHEEHATLSELEEVAT